MEGRNDAKKRWTAAVLAVWWASVAAMAVSGCATTRGAARGQDASQVHYEAAPRLGGGVLAVIAVKSLEAQVRLGEVAERLDPADGGARADRIQTDYLAEMTGALGLSHMRWLRTDGPIYIVFVPADTAEEGVVLLFPVRPEMDPLEALGADARRGDGGHMASYGAQDARWFVDRAPGFVVFSPSPTLWPTRGARVADAVLSYGPHALWEGHADVEGLRATFGGELREVWEQADASVESLTTGTGAGGGAEVLRLELALLKAATEQAKTVRAELSLNADRLVARLGVVAEPDTALERLVTLLGKPNSAPTAAPAGSWLAFTSGLDTRAFPSLGRLARMSVTSMPSQLHISSARAATLSQELGEAMDALTAQETGSSLFAMSSQGAFPMAVRSVTRVENASAARAAYGRIATALLETLRDGITANLSGAAPRWLEGIHTWADVLRLARQQLGALGVSLDAASTREGGVLVDSLALDVDWARLGALLGDERTVTLMQRALGDHLEMVVAWAGSWMTASVGPHARADTQVLTREAREASVNSAARGGDPDMERLLGRGAFGVAFRPQPLFHALTVMAPEFGAMDIFAPQDGLWARATGDGAVGWLEVGVTLGLLNHLASLDDE